MFTFHTIPPPARLTLVRWIGRLAARLADLKEQVRDRMIEAAGQTFAEAAEAVLRAVVGNGFPPLPVRPPAEPEWSYPTDEDDDLAEDSWDEPTPPRRPVISPEPIGCPETPRRSWRAVLVAGLHAVAWWLRRAPSPLVAAAAAVVGAVLVLLD